MYSIIPNRATDRATPILPARITLMYPYIWKSLVDAGNNERIIIGILYEPSTMPTKPLENPCFSAKSGKNVTGDIALARNMKLVQTTDAVHA